MMALYEEFEPQPNRLIDAQSAYLRSAAYQPIGWYEFGPEAFAEALEQDKPIMLDIGAIWCHWCHVMDRESYDNPEIATLINELFIPVKVDRDERPDVDARYQVAVQLLTDSGGWPLTVFLTPDGRPFYGGTYFPPEDRYGRTGLKALLPRIAEMYKNRRAEIDEVAAALTERTKNANLQLADPGAADDNALQHLLGLVRSRFNRDEGGFELAGPKFPHTGAIELALAQWDAGKEDIWRAIIETTLTQMGCGGVYDHLGGGFHRYATDATWTIPHFEKMSFDNAGILANYIHAYRATGNPFFRDIADSTIDFILRDLADHEHGGFYGSQDADNSLEDDGGYWTWTFDEIVGAVPEDDLPIVVRHFGLNQDRGVMRETGRRVLFINETAEEIADDLGSSVDEVRTRITNAKRRLLDTRKKRKAPRIDKNKYANWNGLLISALFEAGALLGRQDASRFALKTIDTLLRDDYEEGQGFYHVLLTGSGARVPGFFDDQIYLANALLDAFAATGKREYLDTAHSLLDLCLDQYWDKDEGEGFFDVSTVFHVEVPTEFLQQHRKVIEDMPLPAPNAIAAIALERLWLYTHDDQYHEFAARTLMAFSGLAPDYGPFAGFYGLALFYYLHPIASATIIGEADNEVTKLLWHAALDTYRPGRQVAVFAPGPDTPYPVPEGGAAAYVCAGQQCAPPTSSPEELRDTLAAFGRASENSQTD
ncbi:MAG: thioredoxin domain-containing protein [Armatimonadota bacterium]